VITNLPTFIIYPPKKVHTSRSYTN
jgi:hypothetical protein